MNSPHQPGLLNNESLSRGLIRSFAASRLNIYVYASIQQTNAAAAYAVANEIRRLIYERGRAVGVFSASLSQVEILDQLAKDQTIQWTRVIGFHTDEFVGVNQDAPQSSRSFLINRLVKRVPMAEFQGLRGEAANPNAVCENYAALLESRPPDFALLAIGDDGQLGVLGSRDLDLNDSSTVKVIDLDESCRRRQLKDRAFAKLEDVPQRALSLTIRALTECPALLTTLTGKSNRAAVRNLIEGDVTIPASWLRTHPNAHLFLDLDSADSLL